MRMIRAHRLTVPLALAAVLGLLAVASAQQSPPAKDAKPAAKSAAPAQKSKSPAPRTGRGRWRAADAGRPVRRLGRLRGSNGGKKVCYALAKPSSSATEPANRPRDPAYIFVSTRPAENVRNEISIVIGYPFKPGYEANADIGSAKYALYTQADGAWVKNPAEEARMVDAMRKGADMVVERRIRPRHQVDRPLCAQGPEPGARPRRAGVQVTQSVIPAKAGIERACT